VHGCQRPVSVSLCLWLCGEVVRWCSYLPQLPQRRWHNNTPLCAVTTAATHLLLHTAPPSLLLHTSPPSLLLLLLRSSYGGELLPAVERPPRPVLLHGRVAVPLLAPHGRGPLRWRIPLSGSQACPLCVLEVLPRCVRPATGRATGSQHSHLPQGATTNPLGLFLT